MDANIGIMVSPAGFKEKMCVLCMRKELENLERDDMRHLNALVFDAWLQRLCSKYEGHTLGEGAKWFVRLRNHATV